MGNSVLIRPWTLAVPVGAKTRGAVALTSTVSALNSLPSAPVRWISPLGCMSKASPSARNSDSGFSGVDPADPGGQAELHLPCQGVQEIDPDGSLAGDQLSLSLAPSRSLARAITPPGPLESNPGKAGKMMSGEPLSHQSGKVDVEQVASKLSLPVVASGLAQGRAFHQPWPASPAIRRRSKKTSSTRPGSGIPPRVSIARVVWTWARSGSRLSISSHCVPTPGSARRIGKREQSDWRGRPETRRPGLGLSSGAPPARGRSRNSGPRG